MIAIAEATRPWSYHSNRVDMSQPHEYRADMDKIDAVVRYIADNPGCHRGDIMRACGYKTAGQVTNAIIFISEHDPNLYEDDEARYYYGGVV